MALVTADQVLDAVAASLKVAVASLPAYYAAPIAANAVAHASAEIHSRLQRRGYDPSQIDAWDHLEQVSRDQALWYALTRGGAYDGYDRKSLEDLDQRESLDMVFLMIAGKWVKPPGGNPGNVATVIPSAAGGIFSWPDPDDPELGKPTHW